MSASASTKRSWMASSTMTRDDAVQRWPVWKKPPSAAIWTALSRSASASTTSGFLPPISICTRAWRSIAAAPTLAPVRWDPVKDTPSTPSWFDQRRARLAVAQHQVEHALGHAALGDDLRQLNRQRRRVVGGLHHHRVAEGERGGRFPRRNGDWEVPRRDQAEHAHGLAVGGDVQTGARGLQRAAVAAQRLAAEIAEDAGRAHDLAHALAAQLALFAADSSSPSSSARAVMAAAILSSRSPRTSGEAEAQAGKASRAADTASSTSCAPPTA